MDFIKKNYEKVLLGLVLIGLVVAVAFLFLLVSQDKQDQQARTNKVIKQTVTELPPPDLGMPSNCLKRTETALNLDFSTTNKLFNPAKWILGPQGPYPVSTSTDLQKLDILRITPLYTVFSLDQVNASDSGVRYGISVEEQAASRPNLRGKHIYFVSVGEKKEYGERKDTFTIVQIKGATNEPTEVVLELSDAPKPISLIREVKDPKEKPYLYKRVEGHMADLKYAPLPTPFLNRRVGDTIRIPGGEEYNIVAIPNESEVTLSAKSNNKKTTIKYNTPP